MPERLREWDDRLRGDKDFAPDGGGRAARAWAWRLRPIPTHGLHGMRKILA